MYHLIPVLLLLLLLGSHLYLRGRRRPLRLRQEVPVVTFAPSSALYPGRVRKPYESPIARAHYALVPLVPMGGTMVSCRLTSCISPELVVMPGSCLTPLLTWPWPMRSTPKLGFLGGPGPASHEENR